LRSQDIEKQPDHVARVLKKFLRGDWELDLDSNEDFLLDKILLEFPVFSLNDDYLKALANIVFMKIESCQNLISQKNRVIQGVVEEREKRARARSLSFLKTKIEEKNQSAMRERSMSPNEIAAQARREVAKNKREQIDTWIARQ
jgi:hypothetical protein